MKKLVVLSFGIFTLVGCGSSNSGSMELQKTTVSNANTAVVTNRQQSETVAAHSMEKSLSPMSNTAVNPANAANRPASGSTESPMARAIDVSAQTTQIEAAEKEFKAKSSDAKVKESLAKAYFDRAFLLTDAAQYRAALGDFRKGLKLNPTDAQAKSMHDQIISIFASIKREPPKEGEEPAPMPFGK
jgi:tetratricopeptide (TPR) repeat protein